MIVDRRLRWLAMYVLCLGDLMIVLDVTIVNVALPSIQRDLGFDAASLAWIVNAYMLTFGGFLLLGGRLGDLYGPRRLFLVGVALFTVASLACGLATTQWLLVAARAFQGLAGAVVSAVGLSLIVNLFQAPEERAKAMGFFGFVSAGGGSIGVLLGGILTQTLSWHWIFLVNVPVGIAVCVASLRLLPADSESPVQGKLDLAGAVTVTVALLMAVYAIINGNEAGWGSVQTVGLLAASLALTTGFVAIEARVAAPLVPLGLFRQRNLTLSNAIGLLWAAGMFATFFISALYLQLVLGYMPLQIGMAFLPTNIIMAAFSLGLSAQAVMRFGIKAPLAFGLFLIAVGLAWLGRAPVAASFALDILPPMTLLGLGAGLALNPLLLAAMGDVDPKQSGLASGLVNTSFMIGGALGLAALASLSAARTEYGKAAGLDQIAALNTGYQAAFLAGALMAAIAVALGLCLNQSERVREPEMKAVTARE